jgi:cytochrome bd ubiquinol oxidase subunit II
LATTLIVVGVAALLLAGCLVHAREAGWAFAATAFAMGTSVVSIFAGLALNVMVSSISHAFILTISDASSAKYALTVMTVVTVLPSPHRGDAVRTGAY